MQELKDTELDMVAGGVLASVTELVGNAVGSVVPVVNSVGSSLDPVVGVVNMVTSIPSSMYDKLISHRLNP